MRCARQPVALLAALLAGTGAATARAASPVPEGLYQGGMGSVEVERAGPEPGFLVGRVLFPSDGCAEPGRVVLDAEEQDGVLVGRIFLCQRGPGCESRPVDFLGAWLPAQRSVVGFVTLSPGCTSPAVGEEGQVLLAHQGGAARPASRPPVLSGRAQQELLRAEALSSEGRAADAVEAYRVSLSYAVTSAGYAGLVRALLATGALEAARVAADRARALDPSGWEPWYLRARCDVVAGELDAARSSLAEALGRGMHPSRREDPEFSALGAFPTARPVPVAQPSPPPSPQAPKPPRAPAARARAPSPPAPVERPHPDDALPVEFRVKPYALVFVNGKKRGNTADDDVLMLEPGRYKVRLTCAELNRSKDLELDVQRGKVNIVRWNFETQSER